MKLNQIARKLGRRGGLARAQRLSLEHKKRIASMGGHARRESLRAVKRIRKNFLYLEAMRKLSRAHV